MSVTKISSVDAVSLLKECGVKSVTKDTNPDDLGKKLKKFIGAAGDLDLSDKHLKKVYKEIAKAYDDGDTVKVFAGKNGKAKQEEDDEEEGRQEKACQEAFQRWRTQQQGVGLQVVDQVQKEKGCKRSTQGSKERSGKDHCSQLAERMEERQQPSCLCQ